MSVSNSGPRLLSIDGGGIRGLSPLLILHNIMHRIQQAQGLPQMPLPCEYFDMMAGTGTGGLIVLMLGRLRMSIPEAMSAYEDVMKRAFSQPCSTGKTGEPIFSMTELMRAFETVIKKKLGYNSGNAKLLDVTACKTFVLARNALNMNAGLPVVFRTYIAPADKGINCTIVDAAGATSAMPPLFRYVQIGDQRYVDGGMGNNNPTQWLIREAKSIFPRQHPSFILSIGSGKGEVIRLLSMVPESLLAVMEQIITDCEKTHDDILRLLSQPYCSNAYFRFNVEQGMKNVSLTDASRLRDVQAHAQNYLGQEAVRIKLRRFVEAAIPRYSNYGAIPPPPYA